MQIPSLRTTNTTNGASSPDHFLGKEKALQWILCFSNQKVKAVATSAGEIVAVL